MEQSQLPNRAGGVVFNLAGQVLLITTKTPGEWVFPKGHIEEGEETFEAVERETAEEAGVKCSTIAQIATSSFMHKDEVVVVEWWSALASALNRIPWFAPEGRQIQWLKPEDALETLSFDDLKQVLRAAMCIPEEDQANG